MICIFTPYLLNEFLTRMLFVMKHFKPLAEMTPGEQRKYLKKLYDFRGGQLRSRLGAARPTMVYERKHCEKLGRPHDYDEVL